MPWCGAWGSLGNLACADAVEKVTHAARATAHVRLSLTLGYDPGYDLYDVSVSVTTLESGVDDLHSPS